jgi:hypothetical protein
MDLAAWSVMLEYPDVVLAFGESDEYRYSISSEPRANPATSHTITRQLLASQIYEAVQSTAIKNHVSIVLVVYIGIRHAMVPMLPRHPLVLPAFVRRADRALPGCSGNSRLLFMAPI